MKIYYIVLLSLLIYFDSFAQVYFPLQKGDFWQYIYWGIGEPVMRWNATITGTTTLSNGKQYSIITGHIFDTNYLRQEGNKVYGYDDKDSAEYVLLDFTANAGDTLSQNSTRDRTIVALGNDPFFNSPVWIFAEYVGSAEYSYEFYKWFIQDSIGLTSFRIEPGMTFQLSGSIISGKSTGTINAIDDQKNIFPSKYSLEQNYPNPFNPTTTIKFIIPVGTYNYTSLRVYDLLGREVATLVNEKLSPGTHTRQWDASGLPSGLYFYRLQVGNFIDTKKLVLMK